MSCGERPLPPPGFGADRRPHRGDSTGTMSATRTSTVVNIETETDDGSLEVLQQSYRLNEPMASQSSSRTKASLAGFHGPIVLYRKGRIVSSDEGNPKNAIYVHKECMDWAPRVYLVGDDIFNMEKEISRSSRLKCSRCKLPGAALGCYHHPCPKNYHVPCAVMIPECCWDMKNRHVWCPKHASDPLPCDVTSSPIMESGITSPILQNRCSGKGLRLLTKGYSQCSGKGLRLLTKGYSQCSAGYRREEKQMNQSRTIVNEKVLLGSALSASQKDSLKKFASLTNSTLVEEWDKNVTHVIVDRSAGITCGRSYEVLMAILSGKWVVRAEWIVDCLAQLIPGPEICLAEPVTVPETSYEVEFFNASHISIEGPKKGRVGAAEGAPKLFSGLHFFLSAYMDLELRENLENLISAAEGKVLEAQESACENTTKVYFVYVGGPPRDFAATLLVDKEIEEARNYAACGAQVICHLWLFDAIMSYDAALLERSYREGR
ncbi:BRCA1-associated RING domain protein 1 isoform X2 [Lolium perenne]|uniref:BRCA1-associated RING domain protein 1 isoform X2 n=1 Tax=Lolium perenne TaxID=4522 RepID=UPI0021F6109E|nr:BRCA1-associated RING domain protein 1-like isoform X2 [Lolium perenne]